MKSVNELCCALRNARWLACAALLALAACQTAPQSPATPSPQLPAPPVVRPVPPPAVKPPPVADKPEAPPAGIGAALRAGTWSELPDWRQDDPSLAWPAFIASCNALKARTGWRDVCAVALQMAPPDRETARAFFEANFTPYRVLNVDGTEEGLVTGYYEPLLRGSRTATGRYRFPVYGVPDDLLVVEMTELHPALKGMRLRGRLEGRRVVPYFDRAQIEGGAAAVRGKELLWVDDAVELFFLQIQGSGRILLESGETVHLGYAEQNGHPYRSIGRLLVERGELPLEQASMQGIKAWGRQNPQKLGELLNQNPSYVFFRQLPSDLPGPLGALGVPLTGGRSVAVDAGFVPLGAPVYLAATWPNTSRPLNRLMLAQDTGGAIRGAVRADFFWGFGAEAAREAGRMKQSLRLWVLLPSGYSAQPQ